MSNNTKLFIKVLRFISKPKFNALVTKFQSDAYAFIRINVIESSLVISILWLLCLPSLIAPPA
jgi:hypothetical protein